jgi:hypothetical protein
MFKVLYRAAKLVVLDTRVRERASVCYSYARPKRERLTGYEQLLAYYIPGN